MHVRLADESVCIGSHQPANSYLNIPAILSAVDLTNSEAVHPGYGFLSENANFAKILEENNVDIIYHAAAYKHVPLVEKNPLQGIINNTLGTKTLIEKYIEAEVNTFVLISTDKAVRPTNVMGASKRIAEMIVQDAARSFPNRKIGIVRFGNVLDSSGSVVPLFREQIKKRIPVTLTHPEITRYFMSIGGEGVVLSYWHWLIDITFLVHLKRF